jgi:hypothetical protein
MRDRHGGCNDRRVIQVDGEVGAGPMVLIARSATDAGAGARFAAVVAVNRQGRPGLMDADGTRLS